jgi:hypothetical protein
MLYDLNQTVRWTSQAQGFAKTKVGVIVEVVPSGQLPDHDKFLSLYRGSGVGAPRNHTSYVVKVGSKIYWPRASKLTQG